MLHADIAEHLIQQIKQAAGRWEMPWHKVLSEPFNGVTGKEVCGQSAVVIWAEGMHRDYLSSQCATLRQWNLVDRDGLLFVANDGGASAQDGEGGNCGGDL